MAILTPNLKENIMPTLETVRTALDNAPKGANITLEWERDVETLKAHSDLNIRKHVVMVGRVEINYENLKAVKEKRANGELPPEPKSPWFYHDENTKGIIYNKRTDAPYVQLFNGTDSRHVPKVKFTLDGKEISKEEISTFITAKERKSEKGDVFCCKLENMIAIKSALDTDIDIAPQTTEVEAEQETA